MPACNSDLHMSDNEIGDEGLAGLARAVARNSSIRLLELCFNRITAAGAEALAKSMWGTTGLRALRLDNNQVGYLSWLFLRVLMFVLMCGTPASYQRVVIATSVCCEYFSLHQPCVRVIERYRRVCCVRVDVYVCHVFVRPKVGRRATTVSKRQPNWLKN